ncbi:multicomponent Na+:H+ antiporter subunit E [Microbacteriaceae bacterium SG_E_30_P1]|uniref:Multicomponent Na+:H+ antiporter subunit E n=1 Tax=Antiquaquibacter oligotrophicus TaxID=2880260 RepID=A0ABT6KNM7_9MICO|nr:Na+/H+ antiporter subunit E [Antiquaquibacter oligotrophicus]MDH6181606.1 multicomponent Na+:H+ antiporter subunit E [Antiquaquibacter oligotrophicus]UDF12708.1 Na+/H+ antiporter subunit E [Antiquaquibacter oligotrophicus]
MTDHQETAKQVRWRVWQQLPLLVALVVLWMLLWGTVSWISVVSGIIVAVAVTRFFYLPPVELSGRFNPFWFGVFLLRFLWDVVRASFQVAWLAFRPRSVRSNAVIAVDLVTASDFITTLTAITISLIPGSLVLEVDRDRSILYLHLIGVDDAEGIDKMRRKVLSVERGIVRAIGSRADVERTGA